MTLIQGSCASLAGTTQKPPTTCAGGLTLSPLCDRMQQRTRLRSNVLLRTDEVPYKTVIFPHHNATFAVWRRGWDSNPRCPCGHGGFQDRHPLYQGITSRAAVSKNPRSIRAVQCLLSWPVSSYTALWISSWICSRLSTVDHHQVRHRLLDGLLLLRFQRRHQLRDVYADSEILQFAFRLIHPAPIVRPWMRGTIKETELCPICGFPMAERRGCTPWCRVCGYKGACEDPTS